MFSVVYAWQFEQDHRKTGVRGRLKYMKEQRENYDNCFRRKEWVWKLIFGLVRDMVDVMQLYHSCSITDNYIYIHRP